MASPFRAVAGSPQHKIPDEFRVGINDTSNEFRLKLEGCVGSAESREVESCWRTAASTIGGRHFTVDVSQVKSLDATAVELLSRMRDSGAKLLFGASGHPSAPGEIEKAALNGPASEDSSFRMSQFPILLSCLLARLMAWPISRRSSTSDMA